MYRDGAFLFVSTPCSRHPIPTLPVEFSNPRVYFGFEVRMTRARISVPQEQIAEFCQRNHIRRLALFGSVLRDDFRPDSDVDVLVEFEPGRTPGLTFFDMEAELSAMLRRRVELSTPGFLSRYIRSDVLAQAEVQYVAA